MLKDHQLSADNNNGSDHKESSFTGPYRHAGYKHTLKALRESLNSDNAVILKGVEGTGKTTLVNELINEYQHKGVPVAVFSHTLTKSAQLYAKLAEVLDVPKQKRALIQALRSTKAAGQFCLVIVDQDAVNSDASVVDALQQLCQTSETTAGAIKLVVVRQDYMVLHTEGMTQADFDNWINLEVTLDPLHIDDIEGLIYYLSAIKGLPPTPYEVGTDFMMIEQTEGRLSRLKALLLPLIHKDVITRKDLGGGESQASSLQISSNKTYLYALAAVLVLAVGFGLNYFYLSEPSSTPVQAAKAPSVFAETPAKTEKAKSERLTPPSVDPTPSKQVVTASTTAASDEAFASLPQLNQDEASTTTPVTEITKVPAAEPVVAKASEKPKSMQEIAALPAAEFQAEVNSKLSDLEQQLSAAMAENLRLKQALEATEKESSKPETNLAAKTPTVSDKPIQTPEAASATADSSKLEETAILASEVTKLKTNPDTEQANEAPVTDLAPEILAATQTPQENANEIVDSVTEVAQTREQATVAQVVPEVATLTTTKSPEAPALTQAVAEISTTTQAPLSPLEIAEQHINRWQNAWQAQDHEAYTSTYIRGFNGAYRTHQRWLKKRYDALSRPEWLRLSREGLYNLKQEEDKIRVDFWLKYEAANGYKDKTLKRLTLVRQGDEWFISKEQNIKVKPFF